MIDDYVDDTQPHYSARRCTLCNSPLSMYNKTEQCFHHNGENIEGGLWGAHFVAQPETHQATKINPPLPRKEEKEKSQSDEIIELACDTLGVPFSDIEGRSRNAKIVHARQIIMYLLCKDTNLSLTKIGVRLGMRYRSTISNGVNNIADKLLVDCDLCSLIKVLRSKHSLQQIKKAENGRDSKPDKIIELVCDTLGVPFSDIAGQSRNAKIVRPRQIIMYLLCKDIKLSSAQVGRRLGMRDPSTIWSGVNNITKKLLVDDDLRHIIENLRSNYQ